MQPARKPSKKVAAAVTDVVFEGADNSIDADNYVVDTSFDDATAGGVPTDTTAEDILAAFATSMRAFARSQQGVNAACSMRALMGVLHFDAFVSEATVLDALMALNSLLYRNAANAEAAHDAGAVALIVSLLRRDTAASEHDVQRSRELTHAALQALLLLSQGDPSCARRVQLGGAVSALVSGAFARTETDPEAAYWGAKVLERISSAGSECTQSIALADGAVGALLAVLECGYSPGTPFTDDPPLLDVSADASESTVSPAAEASMRRLLLKPTGAHRQAAAVAAMTLCALLHAPETSSAVVKAVEAVAALHGQAPRIGHAIKAASSALLALIHRHSIARLRAALAPVMEGATGAPGESARLLAEACAFARTMLVPEKTIGQARATFKRRQQEVDQVTHDRKRNPWKMAEAPAAASPRAPRTPRTPRTPPAVSPQGKPAITEGRNSTGSTTPRAAAPATTTRVAAPAAFAPGPSPDGATRRRSSGALPPPPPLSLPSPGGVSWAHSTTAQRPPTTTQQAEAAIDSHLGAARAVLYEAMAQLKAEHEAQLARSQQEIRNLRAELQSVRQAEAALQAKLATISRSVTLVTRPHGAHQHESTVGS